MSVTLQFMPVQLCYEDENAVMMITTTASEHQGERAGFKKIVSSSLYYVVLQ